VRIQREGESLSAYTDSIKQAAHILKVSSSVGEREREMVANVVDELSIPQPSGVLFKHLVTYF
jgi:hypothetical protein